MAAQRSQHRLDLRLWQALQRNPRRETLTEQSLERLGKRARDVELDVTIGADDDQRDGGDSLGEVLKQEQRRLVSPMQVLEDGDTGVMRQDRSTNSR